MDGKTKTECGKIVSENLPMSIQQSGRMVRTWAVCYALFGKLPDSKQGGHQKTSSLVNDEDFQKDCITWLRAQLKNKHTPVAFHKFISKELIPSKFSAGNASKISE